MPRQEARRARLRSMKRSRWLLILSVASGLGLLGACGASNDDAPPVRGGGEGGPASSDEANRLDEGTTADGGAVADDPRADGGSAEADAEAPVLIDAGPARLITHVFKPSAADARVTTFDDDQYAYLDTRAPLTLKLVLWLAGAGGAPAGDVTRLRDSAGYGFHAVAVRYVNNYAINGATPGDVCANDPDADCHGKVRLEALDGQDHSPKIAVPPQNAIEVRLGKMLQYLAAQHPGEGWESYVDAAGLPRWEKVIVAGTSHGASAAGRISKVRNLAGAVMSAGPFDHKGGQPAGWTSAPSLTPVNKIWGLSHSADSQYDQHLADWAAMNVPGAVTFVDGKPPNWGGSHRLTTARAGGGHGSTSGMTGDGYPTVWKTILGVP